MNSLTDGPRGILGSFRVDFLFGWLVVPEPGHAGQVDHAGVVGDVQTRVEVEDHAVDLAAGGRGKINDRRADFLGRGQVVDARREVGAAVGGLEDTLAGRVDPAGGD